MLERPVDKKYRRTGGTGDKDKSAPEKGDRDGGNERGDAGKPGGGRVKNSRDSHRGKHCIGNVGEKGFPEDAPNFVFQEDEGNRADKIGDARHHQEIERIVVEVHGESFTGKSLAAKSDELTAQRMMANPVEMFFSPGI